MSSFFWQCSAPSGAILGLVQTGYLVSKDSPGDRRRDPDQATGFDLVDGRFRHGADRIAPIAGASGATHARVDP